jgi:hypothetical protein
VARGNCPRHLVACRSPVASLSSTNASVYNCVVYIASIICYKVLPRRCNWALWFSVLSHRNRIHAGGLRSHCTKTRRVQQLHWFQPSHVATRYVIPQCPAHLAFQRQTIGVGNYDVNVLMTALQQKGRVQVILNVRYVFYGMARPFMLRAVRRLGCNGALSHALSCGRQYSDLV